MVRTKQATRPPQVKVTQPRASRDEYDWDSFFEDANSVVSTTSSKASSKKSSTSKKSSKKSGSTAGANGSTTTMSTTCVGSGTTKRKRTTNKNSNDSTIGIYTPVNKNNTVLSAMKKPKKPRKQAILNETKNDSIERWNKENENLGGLLVESDESSPPSKRFNDSNDQTVIEKPKTPVNKVNKILQSKATNSTLHGISKLALTTQKSPQRSTTKRNTTTRPPSTSKRTGRKNKHDMSSMGRPIWKAPMGVKSTRLSRLPNSSRLETTSIGNNTTMGCNTTMKLRKPVFEKVKKASRKITTTPKQNDQEIPSPPPPPPPEPTLPPPKSTSLMKQNTPNILSSTMAEYVDSPNFGMDFSLIEQTLCNSTIVPQNKIKKSPPKTIKSVHPAIARLKTKPPQSSTPVKNKTIKQSTPVQKPGRFSSGSGKNSFCEPIDTPPPIVVPESVRQATPDTVKRTKALPPSKLSTKPKIIIPKPPALVEKVPPAVVVEKPPADSSSQPLNATMTRARTRRQNQTILRNDSPELQHDTFNATNTQFNTTVTRSRARTKRITESSAMNTTITRSRTKARTSNARSSIESSSSRLSTTTSIASRVKGKIDINDPLHRILAKCSDDKVVSLASLFPRGSKITKLGEGVYGEVYSHNGRAIKVIPVNGNTKINATEQMTLREVLPEIAITRLLSDLSENLPYYYSSTFVKLHKVNIAQGIYPKVLDDAWSRFADERGSDNDRPCGLLKGSQMYLVQELSNGGVALEDFQLKTVDQAFSIFHQVALGLAVAESRYEFEHRDLHIGNILIREHTESMSQKIPFELRGDKIWLPRSSVQATIIDFSLSRAIHNDELTLQPWVLFQDLDKDEDLFTGEGDIQFQVYREMSEFFSKRIPNRWRDFRSKTNVLWLEYLHEKLLNMLPKKCKNRKKFQQWRKVFVDMYSCVEYFQELLPKYNQE